jgi:hypothetical protein
MGIAASTEIQGAARKVLEENKKLRMLLIERGVPESEIAAALGANDKSLEEASTTAKLATVLSNKRTCNGQILCSASPCTGQSQGVEPDNGTGSASPPSMASSSVDTPPPFPHSYPDAPITPCLSIPEPGSIPHPAYLDQTFDTPWAFSHEAHHTPQPALYANNSSCTYAASIIRTMREDVGVELEADLGCYRPGQDCMVDNTTVFSVMEKYGNPPGEL